MKILIEGTEETIKKVSSLIKGFKVTIETVEDNVNSASEDSQKEKVMASPVDTPSEDSQEVKVVDVPTEETVNTKSEEIVDIPSEPKAPSKSEPPRNKRK